MQYAGTRMDHYLAHAMLATLETAKLAGRKEF